jgi:hypothetical protein
MVRKNSNQRSLDAKDKPYSEYDKMPTVKVMLQRLLIEEHQAQLPHARLGAGYVHHYYPNCDGLDELMEELELEYAINYDKAGNPWSYWFRKRKKEEN